MRYHASQPQASTRPLLYKVVFNAIYVKWLVLLLFAFFTFHPAIPAFAADDDTASPIAPTDVESPTAPEVSAEVVLLSAVESPVPELEASDTVSPELVADTDSALTGGTPSGTDLVADVSVDATTTEDMSSGNGGTGEPAPEEPDVSSDGDSTTTPLPVQENTTDATADPDVSTNTATTSDSLAEQLATSTATQIVYIDRSTIDPSVMTFDAKNCVTVGQDSFYCSKSSTSSVSTPEDVAFSAQDNDGDTEIFIRLDGETTQISKNLVDDNSPDYDPKAHAVVWQRLVDSQYQIVMYQIDDETETVLTAGNANNMEPSHEAGVTVWQRWIDGNWEIMLQDGTTEQRLTHNTTHDIAPDVRNGFVMWNSAAEDGGRAVSVYEIATGLTSTIADAEGGQVSNPRFVLVYDTELANGDVVTKGFNPETGEVEPLSAMPADAPREIPPADQTGETRALIQNKSATGRESGESEMNATSTTSNNDNGDVNQASSTTATSIGTSTASTTALILDISGTATTTLVLTDFDLIIEPFSGTSSSQLLDSATTSNLVE